MRIRDEIRLSVGTLLLVQVLTMVAAVGLLARMTPAIEQILEDNEKSIRAVEQMLVYLAEDPNDDPEREAARRRGFEAALAVAEGNITEDSELPVLDDISAHHEAALAHELDALELVRTRLRELGDINRQTMLDANDRAKRLGTAGAWALVFLGLVGLAGSIALMRRARVKLIEPVYELGAVLEACSSGDKYRRFAPGAGSREFHDVAEIINELVDEHFERGTQIWETSAKLDRLALLTLLDRSERPTLICDPSGEVRAANEVALERLHAGDEQLRAKLAALARGEAPDGLDVEPLDDDGWICRM